MYIYKIKNKINGKIYIGQTTQRISQRWLRHCSKSNASGMCISRAIQKYGKENFIVEEIDGANSLSELNYLETHYICKFNSLVPSGYNLSSGGGNKRTHPDTKKKLSEALIGIKRSEETKKLMSISKLGSKNYLFGTKHSQDRKDKISSKSRLQKHPILCLENGKTYINVGRAAEDLNIKRHIIDNYLYGRTKTALGYTFVRE